MNFATFGGLSKLGETPFGGANRTQAGSLGRRAVPQRGWTQPRVSTLGTAGPERFALKGRQIERTNNAKVGPIVAVSVTHSNHSISRNDRCESSASLSPLQGELVYFRGSQG
jgi:hypothetical protein